MGNDAAVTVDSSTTEKSGTEVLKDLTPKQMKTWRQTGDLPEAKEAGAEKKVEVKDSKTETDSSTVAAPEKKAEESAKSAVAEKKEPEARTRIGRDLLAENKELKAKLDELMKQQPATAVKTDVAAKPRRSDVDAKTGQALYATDEAFEEAHEKWLTDKVTADVRKQVAKEENDRRVAEQNKLIDKRLENALKISIEKHADFDSVVQRKDETKDGKTVTTFNAPALKAIKIGGMIDSWIVDSEIGAEILYYLATRLEEVERIQSLNAFAAARELTKLEDKLSAAASVTVKEEKGSTAPPKISKAPAPAESVGGKATAPVDEELAATEAGDFRRYKKAADTAEWRQKKAS